MNLKPCLEHPRFLGMRRPRTDCPACRRLYNEVKHSGFREVRSHTWKYLLKKRHQQIVD